MNRNGKLTKIIEGRVLSEIQRSDDAVLLLFDDGSKMKIKTAASPHSEPQIKTAAPFDKPDLVGAAKTASKAKSTGAMKADDGMKSGKDAESAGEQTKSKLEPQESLVAPTSKARESPGEVKPDRKVKCVNQQDTQFSLEFEDGTALRIETLEEMASVMLRDKNGVMEYAD